MGLTCKPHGSFKGVMKALQNQFEKEKAAATSKKKKEKKAEK